MNSISFFKALLMKELNEKDLPGNQEKIAGAAEPKDKITAADFAALRAKKDVKEEDFKLEEKVDMEELEMMLKKLKKDNPGKKVTYSFIKDSPKGYVFYIDKKLVKEGEDNDSGGGTLKIEKQGDKYYWTWNPKSGKSQKSDDGFESKADAQRDFMRQSKYMKESEGQDSELKLGVKYNYKGESGFISTGGSQDPKNWKFLGDKQKYPYLTVKADLVPSEKQPGKYDGAFDLGMGKGHHIDEDNQDHEVSMAQNSLKSIISSASQLMNLLGQDEKDIPAWIQDHITNAENYINQASKNYHEYHNGGEDMDELPVGNEEEPVDDMTLQGLMETILSEYEVHYYMDGGKCYKKDDEGNKQEVNASECKRRGIREAKKPSAGLSKKQKSAIVKKAKSGKDMGKKGKGFEKIVKAAKKSGADNPEAVAGAAFWKGQAKKAK